MEIHPNPPPAHLIEDLTMRNFNAIELQPDHVKVKCRAILRLHRRQLHRKLPQRRIIITRKRISAFDVTVKPNELTRPQSRLNVRHTVVEAKRMLLVVPGRRIVNPEAAFIPRYPMTAQAVSMRCANSGSLVSAMPPSPVVMIFTG